MEIGIGDMIEYGSNGVTVVIYARRIEGDKIMDGNVMCTRDQVIRVVHTAAELKASEERHRAAGYPSANDRRKQ